MKRLHRYLVRQPRPTLRLSLVTSSLIGILALFPFAAPASAQTTLNGGSYTFNTSQDPLGIKAINGASITLLTGGILGSGGTGNPGLELDDTSTLNMLGGSIVCNGFGFKDISTGTSTIAGGSITGSTGNIAVDNIGGGIINVTGGSFSGGLDFFAQGAGSIINIYGTGLHFVGSNVVGTLQDGESINASTVAVSNGQINLIASSPVVPEGDSLVLLGSGLLPLAITAWRRRRA